MTDLGSRRSSARGVQRTITRVVVVTACLVAGLGFAGSFLSPAFGLAGAGLGACGALFIGHWITKRAAEPRLARIRDLAAAVSERASAFEGESLLRDGDEAEFAALVTAVDDVLHAARERTRDLTSRAEVLRSLLEVSPSGVLITDAEGRIRYINPSFDKLVQLRADPVGRLPIEAVPVVEVQTAVDAALAGRSTVDLPCTSDAYEVLLQGVPTDDGGALILAQDVTKFRLAERARTDFVANVSHELRTPMTAILGFAEALLVDADALPEDTARRLTRIHKNARRLRDIFEDLLTLSRIEARRGELPITTQALRPILAEAVAAAADMAHDKGVDFALDCKRDLTATCNPEALSAMVANLAVNACNYTQPGGRVRVRARVKPGVLEVKVQDDGIGIDAAHHQRIFERFYRVDEGRDRKRGGTGLGLAIVKHLALASGARVTVESAPGAGSTFILHLPQPTPEVHPTE